MKLERRLQRQWGEAAARASVLRARVHDENGPPDKNTAAEIEAAVTRCTECYDDWLTTCETLDFLELATREEPSFDPKHT